MHEDDSGYELTDPKHPTYHDRMAERADDQRKRDREPPPELGPPTMDDRAVIVDLDDFLESACVPEEARQPIRDHVYQAFCAGFLLEHGTAYKSMSRYPFGGLHPDDGRLRPAYDEWAERRWDF